MANTLKFGNSEWYGTEGNILAYNDEGGNFKPLLFGFSRGSIATRVNQQGLIETVQANDARVDYKDNANGALLLEPTRTNIALQSNQFNESEWSKTNTSVSANETGVGGSTDAWLLSKSSSNGLIRQFITTTGANTFSVYIKKGSLSYVRLFIASSTESSSIYVNLNNGSTGTSTGSPNVKVVTMDNGWYRCIITKDTTNINNFRIYPANADNDTSGTTGNIYIQNAQVEVGSYATSIINTQGTAQTRLADVCSQTVSSNIITQAEGTLYWSGHLNNLTNYSNLISLSGGGGSWVYILSYSGGLTFEIKSNYSTSLSFNPSGYAEGSHKIAISYSGSEAVIYINGILAHTDNSVVIPSFSVLNIGEWSGYGQSKETKEVKLYNTRLSNSELAALTQV